MAVPSIAEDLLKAKRPKKVAVAEVELQPVPEKREPQAKEDSIMSILEFLTTGEEMPKKKALEEDELDEDMLAIPPTMIAGGY